MEEMNKLAIENINEEVMDNIITEELTRSQKCASYAIVGLIGMGAVSTVYLSYKGIKALTKYMKDKKNNKDVVIENDESIDDYESDIHEIDESTEE